MPFSKYNVKPEHVEAMRAAFNRVCDALRLPAWQQDINPAPNGAEKEPPTWARNLTPR
jgi:hypothetical protein